jgi:hypothetical protein
MAAPIKISRKLYQLSKSLDRWARMAKSGTWEPTKVKVKSFDLIFSLNKKDQAKLFEFRAAEERAKESIEAKYDWAMIEGLARSLGFEDFKALEISTFRTRYTLHREDPDYRVDTSKMVGDYLDGGQNHGSGAKLKRHLDELLNNEVLERVKIFKCGAKGLYHQPFTGF